MTTNYIYINTSDTLDERLIRHDLNSTYAKIYIN